MSVSKKFEIRPLKINCVVLYDKIFTTNASQMKKQFFHAQNHHFSYMKYLSDNLQKVEGETHKLKKKRIIHLTTVAPLISPSQEVRSSCSR